MKVGIIGTGAVGGACLLSLVMRSCAREIVLVNRNRNRADGRRRISRYRTNHRTRDVQRRAGKTGT
jgi:malate/lactate dehydrogenase